MKADSSIFISFKQRISGLWSFMYLINSPFLITALIPLIFHEEIFTIEFENLPSPIDICRLYCSLKISIFYFSLDYFLFVDYLISSRFSSKTTFFYFLGGIF